MFRKHTQFTFGLTVLGLMLSAAGARAQAPPPQFYVVCSSQQNLPTVYVSGIMQGPATAIQGFTAGFTQFLKQTYSYQGAVGCVPGRTIANAQALVQSRSAALRNLKKNVVETGWTQAAPGLAGGGVAGTTNVITGFLAGAKSNGAAPGASQAPGAGQPAGTNVTQGGNSAPGAPVVQIFNNLFAGGSTPSTGSSGGAPSAASGASTAKASANPATAGKGSAGAGTGSNTSTEVATVLSTLFSKAPAGGSGAGGAGDPSASAKPGKNNVVPARAATPAAEPVAAVNGLPDGALGMAQFGSSKLVVYGCGRQGTQVLCVTDLTNENPQDTLVHGDAAWKDAFLVDDRGDRHSRTDGYFLNVDGDRRQEMDIEYGKSAHFILAFDAVQAKVEKVTLRSATGGLHVSDIALIVPGASGSSGEAQSTTNQPQSGTARR